MNRITALYWFSGLFLFSCSSEKKPIHCWRISQKCDIALSLNKFIVYTATASFERCFSTKFGSVSYILHISPVIFEFRDPSSSSSIASCCWETITHNPKAREKEKNCWPSCDHWQVSGSVRVMWQRKMNHCSVIVM